MNAMKLMNFMPLLVMIVSLTFGTYSMQSSGPTPAALAAASGKTQTSAKGVIAKSGVAVLAETANRDGSSPRDPFRVAPKVDSAGQPTSPAQTDPERPTVDRLAELVRSMSLNATFRQGPTEIAIIDGRIYEKGRRVEGIDESLPPLLVVQVLSNSVVLEAESKRYVLAYPDRIGPASGKTTTGGPASLAKAKGRKGSAASPPTAAQAGAPARKAPPRSPATAAPRVAGMGR
jgi:hypothetical protein